MGGPCVRPKKVFIYFRRNKKMFRTFVIKLFYIIFHTIIPTKIIGKENIPKEGAAVLCSNHIHVLDSVSIVSNIKRMMYVIAKEELFKTKIGNWFFRKVGVFPVSRGTGDTAAIETANKHLQDGDLLLIFPEGTRNGLAKGLKFKKGAAYMALQNKVPVIPIGVVGKFKPFTKVTINIGKPMDISEYITEEKVDPRKVITLTSKIQEEVVRLRNEITNS